MCGGLLASALRFSGAIDALDTKFTREFRAVHAAASPLMASPLIQFRRQRISSMYVTYC